MSLVLTFFFFSDVLPSSRFTLEILGRNLLQDTCHAEVHIFDTTTSSSSRKKNAAGNWLKACMYACTSKGRKKASKRIEINVARLKRK
jgi:hypothetical protein